jgi:hypothetical protein
LTPPSGVVAAFKQKPSSHMFLPGNLPLGSHR